MNEARSISLLEQREIEARIVGPLYRAFAAEIGTDRAREIIASVILEQAQNAGAQSAANGTPNDIEGLCSLITGWQAGSALELTIINRNENHLDFDVTRCRFAEMYHRLGLQELGPILSCQRDAAFAHSFNRSLELHRTQTIMEGASHCDFRFNLNES